MPRCPKCNHALANAPEDAREWFRCENCRAGLRLPTSFSKVVFWLCVCGTIVGVIILDELLAKRFHIRTFIKITLDSLVISLYALVTRLIWQTGWPRPQLFDPYSAFNFTESSRKSR